MENTLRLSLCDCAFPSLPPSAYAARLYPLFALHDADPDARVYAFPGGALGLMAGRAVLCGELDDDTLMEAAGWLGAKNVLKPDGGGEYRVLCRTPGQPSPSGDAFAPGDLAESHRILCSDPRFSIAYDRYYWMHSLFRRREAAEVYTQDGATAALWFSAPRPSARCALLCNVATEPALRRQGRASALIQNVLSGLEIPVYLFCLSELCGFYERLGFAECGRAACAEVRAAAE